MVHNYPDEVPDAECVCNLRYHWEEIAAPFPYNLMLYNYVEASKHLLTFVAMVISPSETAPVCAFTVLLLGEERRMSSVSSEDETERLIRVQFALGTALAGPVRRTDNKNMERRETGK